MPGLKLNHVSKRGRSSVTFDLDVAARVNPTLNTVSSSMQFSAIKHALCGHPQKVYKQSWLPRLRPIQYDFSKGHCHKIRVHNSAKWLLLYRVYLVLLISEIRKIGFTRTMYVCLIKIRLSSITPQCISPYFSFSPDYLTNDCVHITKLMVQTGWIITGFYPRSSSHDLNQPFIHKESKIWSHIFCDDWQ